MKKSRRIINPVEIQEAWFLSGFDWPQSIAISRRVRVDLHVNESLGRYTTAYVMLGERVIESYHCYSLSDVTRLMTRIDGRSGRLTAEVPQ